MQKGNVQKAQEVGYRDNYFCNQISPKFWELSVYCDPTAWADDTFPKKKKRKKRKVWEEQINCEE